MAVNTTYQDQVQKAYIAYYGRPADTTGLDYWTNQLATVNGSWTSLINAFGNSAEASTLLAGLTTEQKVNKLYTQMFGRDADVSGLTYYSTGIASGAFTLASVAVNILNGAAGTDATTVANKLTSAKLYTSGLDTTAEILAYNANTVATVQTWLAGVTTTAATQASVDSTLVAVTTGTTATATGTTYTLTTGADNFTGNTFVADNTSSTVLSAADTLTGSGSADTLKIYYPAGTTALTLPTLNSVENLYVNGGTLTAFNVSGVTGLTGLTVDAPVVNTVATITLKGQALTLSNHTTTGGGATTTITSTTDTAETVTLNKIGGSASTLDFTGAALATLNLVTTGAASAISLGNSAGGLLATLNISGSQNLTLVESAAAAGTIKTINAATATGNISVDKVGAAATATTAFTGGLGNDTLKLAAGDIALLTAGSQIKGGAGTDKVDTLDITAGITAGWYTKVNAFDSVETLGLNAIVSIDASKLTSIKSFAVDTAAAQSILNLATGSSLAINVAQTSNMTLSVGTGVHDLAMTVGTATSTGLNSTGTITNAADIVTITSNGVSGTNALTFANVDNSTYTIKGASATSITLANGTAVGSVLDGSTATGALTLVGSNIADTIKGGSGNDTLQTNGGLDTLTGNGGADIFLIKGGAVAGSATAQITITDFVTALDSIQISKAVNAPNGTQVLNTAATSLAAATSVATALNILASGTGAGTNSVVSWGVYNGDTYIVADNNNSATLNAADVVIKLTGVTNMAAADLTLVA